MSSRLFAFNVSKKTEPAREKAQAEASDQWVGDQTASAYCSPCYCTSSNYGVYCTIGLFNFCYTSGGSSYYHCDSY